MSVYMNVKLIAGNLSKGALYRKSYGNAEYPERRERSCPEDDRQSGEGERPLPTKEPEQKIATPRRYLNYSRDQQKKSDSLPILTFPHYPHKKANQLSPHTAKAFFYLAHKVISVKSVLITKYRKTLSRQIPPTVSAFYSSMFVVI